MKRLAIYVLVSCLASGSQASGQGGTITTVAGGGNGGLGDGVPATAASLYPSGIAVDSSGNLFVADSGNGLIRRVSTGGLITTVAGGGAAGLGDGGPATLASLDAEAVAVDSSGNLFIADTNNNRIRKVSAGGIITTVAGNGNNGFSGDGGLAISASLNGPSGVAVDVSGNFFIADTGNNRIRKVSASGIITTVAGNGNNGFSGDGELAISASLNGPTGVVVDASGSFFIADASNGLIRKVSASGIITTVAGGFGCPDGHCPDVGDGGPATSAWFDQPDGVAVDSSGNLYVADSGNSRIRIVSTNGIITTIAGNGGQGFSGDGGPAISATLNVPRGVTVDASGSLFIVDSRNNRVREVPASGVSLYVAPRR